jgi:uncharacterized protein YbjT (DUF2867 family)
VVQGDLEDPASLRAALDGCSGVFGVTNYWEHFEREYTEGKNLVDAVAEARIGHFVFSTLGYPSKPDLEVPHIEIKTRLEEYARSLGLPATYVHVAFYYENFLAYFPPRRRDDGSYWFGFPQGDTPLAAVAAADLGGVVVPIFDGPEEYKGRRVGVVGDDQPCQRYAETMSRVLGMRIAYRHVPREVFAAFGFPGADDLANMFDLNRRFILSRRKDLEESRALYPRIRTFEKWLTENADRFRSVLEAGSGAA